MALPVYSLHQGNGALIVSMPHCGTQLIAGLADRLTSEALDLPDTDWHIPRLYDFVATLGATVITANLSRYVIDLNRPPDDESLYPGQATTGLCPTTLFDGRPLYQSGREPDATEIAARRSTYWEPYHAALTAEITRIKKQHGFVLLYDAHSICSLVPRLFAGRLPDLNLGTVKGASISKELGARIAQAMHKAKSAGFTYAIDGRFIGGYITRHYGQPSQAVQAVQMELAQDIYMNENSPPFDYLIDRAKRLQPVLQQVIEAFLS